MFSAIFPTTVALVFAKQTLFLALFVLYGYVVGKAVLLKLSFDSLAEDCCWSITIGWAAAGVVMMSLGLARHFNGYGLLLALLLVFVMGCGVVLRAIDRKRWHDAFRRLSALLYPSSFFPLALAVAACAYLSILIYASAYPVTAWDAVSYHLPVAREWIRQQWLAPAPTLRFPVHPQFMELFFAPGLLLGEASFATAATLAMFLVMGGMVYSFCRRFFSPSSAGLAAALFFSCPVCVSMGAVPYVDIGAALFFFAGLYGLCAWFCQEDHGFRLPAACCWGIAWSIKYDTLIAAAVFAVLLAFMAGRKGRFSETLVFMFVAAAVALPWYMRNRLLSGDWFFPIFSSHGPFWDALDLREQVAQLHAIGGGRGPVDLLVLPMRLIAHGELFEGSLGLLALVPLGSLCFLKRWPLPMRILCGGSLCYGLIWFFSFQVARYLLPMLPALAVIGGWTLTQMADAVPAGKRQGYRFLLAGVSLLALNTSLGIVRDNGSLPTDAFQRREFLSRHIPSYRAIDFLNRVAPSDARIYALCDEGAVFYYDRPVMGDWFGPARYRDALEYLEEPASLYRVLRRFEADFLLVHKDEALSAGIALLEQDPLFRKIYNDRNASVFELAPFGNQQGEAKKPAP